MAPFHRSLSVEKKYLSFVLLRGTKWQEFQGTVFEIKCFAILQCWPYPGMSIILIGFCRRAVGTACWRCPTVSCRLRLDSRVPWLVGCVKRLAIGARRVARSCRQLPPPHPVPPPLPLPSQPSPRFGSVVRSVPELREVLWLFLLLLLLRELLLLLPLLLLRLRDLVVRLGLTGMENSAFTMDFNGHRDYGYGFTLRLSHFLGCLDLGLNLT
jgi:hypothetical protein